MKLSPEIIQAVKQAWRNRKTAAQISADLNISIEKIFPYIKETRKERTTEIIRQHQDGLTTAEIGILHKLSSTGISSILEVEGIKAKSDKVRIEILKEAAQKYNITLPPNLVINKPQKVKDQIRAQEMLTLRKSGETLENIGCQYNLTRERVRQILQNSFPMQSAKELKQEIIKRKMEKN